MFETIKNAFKSKEIRIKMLITLLLLLAYRIGCFIPVPGIITDSFSESIVNNTFLGIMSAVSGGSLAQGTLLAMGIGPYINASIIMQLLTVAIPKLERWSKEGESGRRKISQWTRYLTMALAIIQALGILLNSQSSLNYTIFGENMKWLTITYMVILYTAGAAITMWLGERITEYGISNGISLLIFVGIISTAGNAIGKQLYSIFTGGGMSEVWILVGFLIALVVVFTCMVAVDLAERKISVQYAKQVKGRKMYGGQSSHIPIKVNASGVLPLIFAFALISFPDMVFNMFWPGSPAQIWYSTYMGAGSWLYPFVLTGFIIFFAYFYSQIQFNPEDISKNIQSYGGFIPGIRPGKPTTDYLKKISNRLTLFGAIYLAIVALVPTLIFQGISGGNTSLINAFSTTGLLIVVSVALELQKQLESQIMMKHYKGFLK